MMKRLSSVLVFSVLLLLNVAKAAELENNDGVVTIRHPGYELKIYPKEGGRGELFLKSGGLYPADQLPQSLLRECFSEQAMGTTLPNVAYTCKTEKNGSSLKVILTRRLTEKACGIDVAGIELTRTIIVDLKKPTIVVSISMNNVTKQNRYVAFGIQNRFRINKFNESYTYLPTTRNVLEMSKSGMVWNYYANDSDWEFNPTAGWLAVNDPKHRKGLAFVFDYNQLEGLYTSGTKSTIGWYYDGGFLPPGKTFETSYRLIPITGFNNISFVSKDLIAGVKPPAEGRREVGITIQTREPGKITASLKTQSVKTRQFSKLGDIELKATANKPVSTMLKYPKSPDSACNILVTATIAGKVVNFHQHAENGFRSQPIPALPMNMALTIKAPERKRENEDIDLALSIERKKEALIFYGIYTQFYKLDDIFAGWQVKLSDSPPARAKFIPSALTIDQYSIIVLSDINAGCLPGSALRRLVRYVKNGGNLLVLGGPYAYGQGNYQKSMLNDLLPVKSAYFDLKPDTSGQAIKSSTKDLSVQGPLNFYWRHHCPVKPGAEIWLKSGDNPILVSGTHGKGRVTCFLTAPLGQAKSGQTAFWDSPAWVDTMKQVVSLLHRKQQMEAK